MTLSEQEARDVGKEAAGKVLMLAQGCSCGIVMWDAHSNIESLESIIESEQSNTLKSASRITEDILGSIEEQCGVDMSKAREEYKKLETRIKESNWGGARYSLDSFRALILGPVEKCASEKEKLKILHHTSGNPGESDIPKTIVTSLSTEKGSFAELEVPVARAVEALIKENPWSSGFHSALNQRWTIVFRGKISERAIKAAGVAGLEVSYREAPVGSGQILTDVSLPGVGVTETEKATQSFNKFAELYKGSMKERPPANPRKQIKVTSPIIHEATSESPDPAELMPIEVPSAFPKGAPSIFNPQEKAQIDRFINDVPDKNDTRAINYWLDWGKRYIYLEGWCDKCLTGTGFPPMEGGEWDDKIQYMVDITHGTLIRKQTDGSLSPTYIAEKLPLTLIEGGFRQFEAGDKNWLYGVTWGVYEKHSSKLDSLPEFHGKAWRVEYENWGIPSGATAGDIIRFEKEELGNDYGLSEELIAELDKYSARDIIWVTKTRKEAKKYLSEGRPESDIMEVEDLEGSRIVADDGEGGYLVLRKR